MGFVLVRASFQWKTYDGETGEFPRRISDSGSSPAFDAVPPNDFRPLTCEGLGPLPVRPPMRTEFCGVMRSSDGKHLMVKLMPENAKRPARVEI